MGSGVSRFGFVAAAALATAQPSLSTAQPSAAALHPASPLVEPAEATTNHSRLNLQFATISDAPPVSVMDGGRTYETIFGPLVEVAPQAFVDAKLTRDFFEIPAAASATGQAQTVTLPPNLVFLRAGAAHEEGVSTQLYSFAKQYGLASGDEAVAAFPNAAAPISDADQVRILNSSVLVAGLANARLSAEKNIERSGISTIPNVIAKMNQLSDIGSSAHTAQNYLQSDTARTAELQNGGIIVLGRNIGSLPSELARIPSQFLNVPQTYVDALPSFVTLHEISHTQDTFLKIGHEGQNTARSEFHADVSVLDQFSPGFRQYIYDSRAIAALNQPLGETADNHQSHMAVETGADGAALSDERITQIRSANIEIQRIVQREIERNTSLGVNADGAGIYQIGNGAGRAAAITSLHARGAFNDIPAANEMVEHYLGAIDRLTTPEYKQMIQGMRTRIDSDFAIAGGVRERVADVMVQYDPDEKKQTVVRDLMPRSGMGAFSDSERVALYQAAIDVGAFEDAPDMKRYAQAVIARDSALFGTDDHNYVRSFSSGIVATIKGDDADPVSAAPVSSAPVTSTLPARDSGADTQGVRTDTKTDLSLIGSAASFNTASVAPARVDADVPSPAAAHVQRHTHTGQRRGGCGIGHAR